MENNLKQKLFKIQPGASCSGLCFLLVAVIAWLPGCDMQQDAPKVGLDYCLQDTSYHVRKATDEEYKVFVHLIRSDTIGHYMHKMLTNDRFTWYATLHTEGTSRSATQFITEKADTVYQRHPLSFTEGQYLLWQQGKVWRLTLLVPQQRVHHLLQLDAVFDQREGALQCLQYLENHPLLSLCEV